MCQYPPPQQPLRRHAAQAELPLRLQHEPQEGQGSQPGSEEKACSALECSGICYAANTHSLDDHDLFIHQQTRGIHRILKKGQLPRISSNFIFRSPDKTSSFPPFRYPNPPLKR